MGLIQEFIDLLKTFRFYDIVHEYEQGLYFRNGKSINKRLRLSGEKLESIVEEEKKLIQENGGMLKLMFPHLFSGKKPNLPEGYSRSWITGLPRHPDRKKKQKVLMAGIYFNIPVLDEIIIDYAQEKVLNLGNITVPTIDEDSKSVIVSCNVRYQLMDFYRAYTAVHDYETSLKDYTISILAKHSRGKKYEEWKDSKVIEKLQDEVRDEVREIVTAKWGLKIHNIYITDNVSSAFERIAYEGNPLPMSSTQHNIEKSSSI